MKLPLRTLAALLLITAILASCSVQKRRYNKGWHVSWTASHNSTPKKEQRPAPIQTYVARTTAENTNTVIVSARAAEQTTSSGHSSTQKQAQASVKHHSQPLQHPMVMAMPVMKNKVRPINTTSKARGFDHSDNTDILGIISFVSALLGLCVLAIIFGVMALRGYREGGGDSNMKIFAQIGLILGIVETVLFILVLVIVLAAFSV